jgi:hypothetical protein
MPLGATRGAGRALAVAGGGGIRSLLWLCAMALQREAS